jgi:hypothetical protein
MAKLRFWRWQQTDELGMPCPTRFPLSDAERNGAEDLQHERWPLEAWSQKPSASSGYGDAITRRSSRPRL